MTKLKGILPILPDNLDKNSLYLHAIVDCAHFDPCFYKMFIKNKQIESQSLLAKTPYKKSVEAGPLLVRIDNINANSIDIINEILFAQTDKPSVVWFWSAAPFSILQRDLTDMLFVEKEEGGLLFFRYYDPRCLKDLLQALSTDDGALKYLQQIACWTFNLEGQYHYLCNNKEI